MALYEGIVRGYLSSTGPFLTAAEKENLATGAETIVLAFAVVVIGGLGSLPGAALAAVLVGLVRAAAVHYRPELDLFAIYFVMAVVLIMRPKGLFSIQEARKI